MSQTTGLHSTKLNLCSGSQKIQGWLSADITPGADLVIDLEKDLLPLPDNSLDAAACISAINYFSRERAIQILRDLLRALKPGGIVRFGVQDLEILTRAYLDKNEDFYCQKLSDGTTRFPGKTLGDKLNAFFYGFASGGGKTCRHVYDFESLKALFEEAGFGGIVRRKFREGDLPQVELLDNRPEQMFFLEARKGGIGISPVSKHNESIPVAGVLTEAKNECDAGTRLWAAGQREEGWQRILRSLQLNPLDPVAITTAGSLMEEFGRLPEAIALYRKACVMIPGHRELTAALARAEEGWRARQGAPADLAARRSIIQSVTRIPTQRETDEAHLTSAINWLLRAWEATGRRGVSAQYDMVRRCWDVAYPETTGYIIASIVAYARLTNTRTFIDSAIAMADWEIAIQTPMGATGEAIGVFNPRPRIFNTSQVILGWIALYRETGEMRFLMAASRAADWITTNQDLDGKWTNYSYAGPRTYYIRTAWSLLELYHITRDERYRFSALRNIEWVMQQCRPNGWFGETSLTDPFKPWTHLIGYTMVGLAHLCRYNNMGWNGGPIIERLTDAAQNMIRVYDAKESGAGYGGMPATFDPEWKSVDRWSCVTGNAQLAYFFRQLQRFNQDQTLTIAADRLIDDLKRIHLIDATVEPALEGGLPGSDPVSSPYCTDVIPNWGVKFFADALLQKMAGDGLGGSCLG